MRTALVFLAWMAVVCAVAAWGQADPAALKPLRTAPVEKFAVNAGFRDWGPSTLAGTTILAGSPTGAGGLFAVDTVTGKLKWSHRPSFSTGTGSISTPPAVSGGTVIVPYAAAYPGAVVAVSLATGKELWRGPDPVQDAAVATYGDLAYILSKNGAFYALDLATGRERWKVVLNASRPGCASRPIVMDGTIYLTSSASAVAGDAKKPAGNYLLALDAKTGQERWRYRAEAPYVHQGVCLGQPVVTATTIYGSGESYLYAVERETGRDRWKAVEIRRTVEGRDRPVSVFGLVDAGSVLVGITMGHLIAFEKESGRTAWELAGQYTERAPSTAVAGRVLYFQGSPANQPAPAPRGTLYALDLDTRTILWSYSRKTAEANWSFGAVTPVDGGLWVDSYQALVKLQ
ncbi:outer membrane protein assembly factor BamB family protein [Paludibaculum fermentans]|uniref:PQQ-binding-like beta-propeller repeat protein n=1 Tax=Paludibaculum fermentans TaxID=1473598 RepID=A0A7S7NND8_PALFE|nr:PQQ-binding-like beta-propeller repeat protein [Paludibaculum fermentans]QOY86832.1 PQQ-binding-like beta-propeller repeat protein [Paludibaculum fermentans]